jgi:hypothetical protein
MVFHSFFSFNETIWMLYDLLLIILLPLITFHTLVSAFNAVNILWVNGAWGSVVVKALCYWSDIPRINSRWCHWGFYRGCPQRNHVLWGRVSPWKWVPGISPGVKAAGAYGWRPASLVVPNVKKIQGLNLPGTPWATLVCWGMTFVFYMYNLMYLLCVVGSVVTILNCSLTEEGHPVVCLSTGKAYMFSAELGSW